MRDILNNNIGKSIIFTNNGKEDIYESYTVREKDDKFEIESQDHKKITVNNSKVLNYEDYKKAKSIHFDMEDGTHVRISEYVFTCPEVDNLF